MVEEMLLKDHALNPSEILRGNEIVVDFTINWSMLKLTTEVSHDRV